MQRMILSTSPIPRTRERICKPRLNSPTKCAFLLHPSSGFFQLNICHLSRFTIPFLKSEWAEIVRNSLEVDKELKPTIVRRTFDTADGQLHVYAPPTPHCSCLYIIVIILLI
jgi:hypothetical protein